MGNSNDNAVVLKESYSTDDIGSVQIADDVVAMIAALAANEVEGVSSPVGEITNEAIRKMGMKKLTKGVKVDIIDNVATVDISLVLQYGHGVQQTCQNVQAKVKTAIENMTGLTVSDVNIRITGVKVQ